MSYLLVCQTNLLNFLRFYSHVISMEQCSSLSGQSFICVTTYVASSVGKML